MYLLKLVLKKKKISNVRLSNHSSIMVNFKTANAVQPDSVTAFVSINLNSVPVNDIFEINRQKRRAESILRNE